MKLIFFLNIVAHSAGERHCLRGELHHLVIKVITVLCCVFLCNYALGKITQVGNKAMVIHAVNFVVLNGNQIAFFLTEFVSSIAVRDQASLISTIPANSSTTPIQPL